MQPRLHRYLARSPSAWLRIPWGAVRHLTTSLGVVPTVISPGHLHAPVFELQVLQRPEHRVVLGDEPTLSFYDDGEEATIGAEEVRVESARIRSAAPKR